jgi:hypothetical protein
MTLESTDQKTGQQQGALAVTNDMWMTTKQSIGSGSTGLLIAHTPHGAWRPGSMGVFRANPMPSFPEKHPYEVRTAVSSQGPTTCDDTSGCWAASSWKSSSPTKPSSHAAMPEINGLTIHQRASPYDARNAMSPALLHCRRRHTSVTKGSMKPNTTHLPLDGLPHDLRRHAGMRGDHDAIKIAGYAAKVWIAPCAFHF